MLQLNLQNFLALIPILWLIVALVFLKIPGHVACASALLVAAVLALTLWQMQPTVALTSALEGFASALWPIILVIIAAIFVYNLSLKSGAMDIMKRMLTGVSADQRVLILLIGWCFAGFLEGMAGFGTAIAIPAGILVGMGTDPILACVVCMLANAFPTAFGSVGIPTTTLANVTSLDILPLSFTEVLQMTPFMILVPFLMIIVGGKGLKALQGMVGITLVAGLSFVIPELLVAKFIGSELPVIVGSVVSLCCTLLMANLRKNAPVPPAYDLSSGSLATDGSNANSQKTKVLDTSKDSMSPFVAWLPFVLIFVLLLLTSKLVPPINHALSGFSTSIKISTSEKAGNATFSWINTPGIWIFVAAIISGIAQKIKGKLMWETLIATVKQMSKTIITIMSVLAAAKIMTYSGMISSMAGLFVGLTGGFYPFVAPIVAAIGAFVTGSGTSTQVLLGSLQSETAIQIGVSPYWLSAANAVGAGIGKILSPQCIGTALAAVNLAGQDSKLLNAILKWALLLLVIACLIIGLCEGLLPQGLLPN
ncbi:L-lactate permease [Lachnospiraceae bacterium ZAX-1]